MSKENPLQLLTDKQRDKTYYAAKTFIERGFHLIALNSTLDNDVCTCGKKNCSSPGKHPLFKNNWKVSATNNLDKVSSWFTKSSNRINLAVATGRKSLTTNKYLIVVDIDQSEHAILEKLPETFCYRTGSGGHHYWYWSKHQVPNSAGSIANKVDIRGTNGYLVVPPSRHISGSLYHFEDSIDFKTEIVDLPDFIYDLAKEAQLNKPTLQTQKKARSLKPAGSLWPASLQVKEIRQVLGQGKKIPEGIRNSTIHRLLSSDRARGADESRLNTQATCYKVQCENYTTLTQVELDRIVASVMKYPAYDTSYDKVNERFFDYKKQAGKQVQNSVKDKILELDKNFFESLPTEKRSYDNMVLNSLQTISKEREAFFQKNGIKGSMPKYRPQLLAKKLESLGFSRHRTSKGNLWDVDLTALQLDQTMVDLPKLSNGDTNNHYHPYQETTLNMTVKVTESNNSFKITRKNHPNERMYKGRATMETQGALTQALECLDDDQFSELALGTLIHDEDSTAELFDSILPGDVIGLCTLEPKEGWIARQYEVLEIDSDADMLKCQHRFSPHKERIVTFEEVSIGLLLGRAEILLRDGKPYGLTEDELNMTVEIVDLSKKPEEDGGTDSVVTEEDQLVQDESISEIFEMGEDGTYVQDSTQGDSSSTNE